MTCSIYSLTYIYMYIYIYIYIFISAGGMTQLQNPSLHDVFEKGHKDMFLIRARPVGPLHAGMPHSYVWHDSFLQNPSLHDVFEKGHKDMSQIHMTPAYVWHITPHSYVWHDPSIPAVSIRHESREGAGAGWGLAGVVVRNMKSVSTSSFSTLLFSWFSAEHEECWNSSLFHFSCIVIFCGTWRGRYFCLVHFSFFCGFPRNMKSGSKSIFSSSFPSSCRFPLLFYLLVRFQQKQYFIFLPVFYLLAHFQQGLPQGGKTRALWFPTRALFPLVYRGLPQGGKTRTLLFPTRALFPLVYRCAYLTRADMCHRGCTSRFLACDMTHSLPPQF